MKRIIAAILAASLLVLCSCGAKNGNMTPEEEKDVEENNGEVQDEPTIADITDEPVSGEDDEPDISGKIEEDRLRDFCVTLSKRCVDESGNSMISPASVMLALGMLTNGAGGDTSSQLETMLGMSKGYLNDYLRSFADSIQSTEDCKISTANSVWMRNDENKLTVNEDFLKLCKDYYGAGVFSEKFDKTTCGKINKWIEDETFGLIKGMLDSIPDDAMMYLINAIGFDAKWENPYFEYNVCDGKFKTADGSEVDAKYMRSVEHKFISADRAVGFIKPYKGGRYAYAAILPDEGIPASDYLKMLSGDALKDMLAGATNETVFTMLPKYKSEYSIALNDVLEGLGMKDAFDAGKADFTPMATSENGNIYVSRVLHKSYIEVAEDGTKAGAATIVEMVDGESAPDETEPKLVYLTRPFVYVIFDTVNNMPLFIGCENNAAQ